MRNNITFKSSIVIVCILVAIGMYSSELIDIVSTTLYNQVIEYFGWIYHVAAFFFLVFCFVLAFGPYGNVKLGKDMEKPKYSYFAWFSMLFAAGMGIGLVFWGVAEPLSHYLNPPGHVDAGTKSAGAFAMRYSFFHWGLQPWAIYIIMSLSLAYFSYRRNLPSMISSCFYPVLGEKIYKTPGHIINVLAVFATIVGVSTSLGFGALQIGSGLNFLYGIPDTIKVTIIIIAIVTVCFLASSIIGLDRGIQTLSKFNMSLGLVLLLCVLLLGPTWYIFNVFISTSGSYINNLLEMSLQTFPFEGHDWSKTWTIFYLAWWIGWSPFVGIFIARISRGRTIREFILGTLLVSSFITFVWFSVFGGTALHMELQQGISLAQRAVSDVSTALFVMFSHFQLSDILSLVAILLLLVFFITSADSATFVLGMMTSNGDLNPPASKKVAWGLTESLLAIVLLKSGGLEGLQQMIIVAALPFTFIMFMMCYNLNKALDEENKNVYKGYKEKTFNDKVTNTTNF